ncbi:MAG: hypothetical protein KAH07_03330 [Flavobacteriaceae bacterium]|nr:hypothetical protein [Flavobacteriaceae bacterium]
MRKLLLIGFVILGITSINGQEKGEIRVGLDLGAFFNDNGGSGLLSLETKYNLTDNSNIGIRIGTKVNPFEFLFDDEYTAHIIATYDYYFHYKKTAIFPFLGGGLGLYEGFNSGNNFGGMIRAGLELSKFRLTLEYNIIPGNNALGYKNSYFGTSVGFYIGGGKWKRKN